MADSPYITWYTSDFLNGVADLTLEQIGVYAIVLNLIADKGSPITDDCAWISRRCGTSVRNCRKVLEQLEAMGKLERRNGLIGNRRMLREVEKRAGKSDQSRDAARARWRQWRADNKPQLPLEGGSEKPPINSKKSRKSADQANADAQNGENGPESENSDFISGKSATFSQDKREIIDGIISEKSQNSADPAMQPHTDSRAGVIPESESIQTNESLVVKGGGEIVRSSDFIGQFEAVCAAAGFAPSSIAAQVKAQDYVKAWRELGTDFAEVVIPTIQTLMLNSQEPTCSLARFDRQIRHEHSKRAARANGNGKARPPLPDPITRFEDEPELAHAIRADMLAAMKAPAYSAQAHSIRLEIADGAGPHEQILYVHPRGRFFAFWDGQNPQMMRHFAQKHGLTDAWKGR